MFVAWNRKWRSSSPIPTLGIGNGGVPAKFQHLESGMQELKPSSMFGIGNGGVRAKFRHLETGKDEFEPSSRF